MTSPKSSFNPFGVVFRSALKENFMLPLLNLIAFTIFVPVPAVLAVIDFTAIKSYTDGTVASVSKITDLFKYMIFNPSDEMQLNINIHVAVFAFSILLGIMMFRYIASKKKVNVFYSLGITRKSLFTAKYSAGILMLFVSIAVPFLACLIINISTFGSSPELWSAAIYYILGYCALSFTAFSVTAAVFSCVGTVMEGITFSCVILLGQTMFFYSVQYVMKKLTLGSPFGYFHDLYYPVYNDIAINLSRLNPVLFLSKNLAEIGSLSRETTASDYVWIAPHYGDVVVWLIISAAVFALGLVLFHRRKPEIGGFPGANKWLNFVAAFFAGFFFFGVAVSNIHSVAIGMAAGLLIYTVLFMIISFVLTFNLKKWKKELRKLPVHIGVLLLIVIILSAGLFGFSSRMPKPESIESAEISPAVYSSIVPPYRSMGFTEDFLFTIKGDRPIDGFVTQNDIKTITGIHELFIDTGKMKLNDIGPDVPADEWVVGTAVKITYHLKNGKTMNRYYVTTNMALVTAMLALEETDRYKELINQTLIGPVPDSDRYEPLPSDAEILEETFIIPNRLNAANKIALSTEKRAELFKALAQDLTAQTVNERYFPETPALGAILYNIKVVDPDESLNGIDAMQEEDAAFGLAGNFGKVFIITKDMVNTLRFLDENDFTRFVENSSGSEFVAAQVIAVANPQNGYYNYSNYYNDSLSFWFLSGWKKADNHSVNFTGSYKVTGKALIAEIAANAHISYLNNGTGYFVKFELQDNGGFTTMHVPAGKMPQSVADAIAAKGTN